MSAKKIVRKTERAKLAGVCGAIAAFLGISPCIVRILYSLLTALSAFLPGILFYLFLMLIFPREPSGAPRSHDVVRKKRNSI